MYLARFVFWFIFIVSLTQSYIYSQKVTITAKIDTNNISIGDQIGLVYTLIKEKGIQTEPLLKQDSITKGIEIIGIPKIDSVKTQDHICINIKYIITSFDTGVYTIPPQSFHVYFPNESDTLLSQSIVLSVRGVTIDTTGTIRDIKAPARAPVSFLELLPFILGIIILGVSAYLVYRFIHKKPVVLSDDLSIPNEPAYITALRELDKIRAQKLWQQRQIKEYYTRITYIIRWYISKQFGIQALEQTSDEILDHIKSQKLELINFENLENLLNLADLVKFAKGEPNPDENIIHLDNACEFIKTTKAHVLPIILQQQEVTGSVQSFISTIKVSNAGPLSDSELYNELEKGGKLVRFKYCISMIFYTYRGESPVYLVMHDEKGLNKAWIFNIITLILGWWGIPWGPVWSINALSVNFKGGREISNELTTQI